MTPHRKMIVYQMLTAPNPFLPKLILLTAKILAQKVRTEVTCKTAVRSTVHPTIGVERMTANRNLTVLRKTMTAKRNLTVLRKTMTTAKLTSLGRAMEMTTVLNNGKPARGNLKR